MGSAAKLMIIGGAFVGLYSVWLEFDSSRFVKGLPGTLVSGPFATIMIAGAVFVAGCALAFWLYRVRKKTGLSTLPFDRSGEGTCPVQTSNLETSESAVKQGLSKHLQPFRDLELALGNRILRTVDSEHASFPMAIIFEKPLHRAEAESRLGIRSPVVWYNVGRMSGFVNEDDRQSLQGPTPPIAEVARDARARLSIHLQSIYDLEISLGNSVEEVDEPAGDLCPLAIIFSRRLHRAEVESSLALPASVRWWECHDSHYPIQGGYKCDQTRHAVAGPLS